MRTQGRSAALRAKRGSISVLVAVASPALLGAAGLMVDTGVIYREQTRLQIAADAAAMGGGRLLAAKTASTSDFAAAGLLEAQAVTGSRWIGTLSTPITVNVAADWSSIAVTLTSQADAYFMRALAFHPPVLTASATSGFPQATSPCVLTTSSQANPGITVSGSSYLNAPACAVFSDSTSSNSIDASGGGSITGSSVGAAGGISASGNSLISPSSTNPYASRQADPYASLQAPTPGGCGYSSQTFNNGMNFTQSNNVFCGTTQLNGSSSSYTFAPGIYYFVNGNFDVSATTVATATGVTFVLTGTSPGAINISGSGTLIMSAPTSGTTAGMLVWQTCPSSGSSGTSSVSGSSSIQATGAIYLPCGEIDFTGSSASVSGTAGRFSVVAAKVQVTGGASLNISPNTQLTLLQ